MPTAAAAEAGAVPNLLNYEALVEGGWVIWGWASVRWGGIGDGLIPTQNKQTNKQTIQARRPTSAGPCLKRRAPPASATPGGFVCVLGVGALECCLGARTQSSGRWIADANKGPFGMAALHEPFGHARQLVGQAID